MEKVTWTWTRTTFHARHVAQVTRAHHKNTSALFNVMRMQKSREGPVEMLRISLGRYAEDFHNGAGVVRAFLLPNRMVANDQGGHCAELLFSPCQVAGSWRTAGLRVERAVLSLEIITIGVCLRARSPCIKPLRGAPAGLVPLKRGL